MSKWCDECYRNKITGEWNSCNSDCPAFGLNLDDALKKLVEQGAEIKSLNKEVDRLSQVVLYYDGQMVDTINEFAERARDELQTGNIIMDKSICDIINYIADKMKEEIV